MLNLETYEQAVERTGRKHPYRTEAWPCPACQSAECDCDTVLIGAHRVGGADWRLTYQHREENVDF